MKRLLIGLLLALVFLFALREFAKSPTTQMFGHLIHRVETTKPLVALTFDDGPSKKHTASVLATLEKYDVNATFFVTGHEAKRNPVQMRSIVEAGHGVGNHSFHHARMIFISPSRVRDELNETDSAIRAAGYEKPITFRPPFGLRLVVLPWVLRQQQKLTVMWDVEPDSDVALNAKQIAQNAIEGARPGSIILLHPMYDSRSATREALGPIIVGLREKGLEPVALSQLLEVAEAGNGAED